MLKSFTDQELLFWPDFKQTYQLIIQSEMASMDVEHILKALQARVTEHNIRVIASYYTQIRLVRLAELLDLDVEVHLFFSLQKLVVLFTNSG